MTVKKEKRTETGAQAVLYDSLSHLLRRSHFYAEALFADELGHYDVTSRQLAILVAVRHNPGASQRVLAEVVNLDVNTVSDLLRRMTRKGLVKRLDAPTGGRSLAISLTKKGQNDLDKIMQENRRYQGVLAGKLTVDEAKTIKRLLTKMLDL